MLLIFPPVEAVAPAVIAVGISSGYCGSRKIHTFGVLVSPADKKENLCVGGGVNLPNSFLSRKGYESISPLVADVVGICFPRARGPPLGFVSVIQGELLVPLWVWGWGFCNPPPRSHVSRWFPRVRIPAVSHSL
jgi:hypothetical protein